MEAQLFKEKYMSFHQKLYRIAYRLLEDGNDAEDMVQEAYIKLWNKRAELNHLENTESYTVVILRNLCLDFLRSKNRHREQSMDDVDYGIADSAPSALAEIESNDEVKQMQQIIDSLPDQQRKVMKMKHLDDYSLEEIEEMTGLSSVNVRVLLSRARKKVRELFDKQHSYGT